MSEAVNIACCPVHGLHGERSECFVCGGPVEQVEFVRLDEHLEFVDPDLTVAELLAWAERYGDPEIWAKRAQAAHARADRLAAETDALRRDLAELRRRVDNPTLWTEAAILDAFRAWADRYGRPPSADDWRAAAPDRSHPANATVIARFGRWSVALERAGFPPNPNGGAAHRRRP